MKKIFSLNVLLFLFKFLIAQDTTLVDDYYSNSNQLAYKIQQVDVFKYEYNNKIIGEREMKRMLMKTNDKAIIHLVQLSKEANALQYIGFAAIPLGIGGLSTLVASTLYLNNQNTGLIVSAVLFSGAITCPILSKIYRSKRIKYNRKAIKLYNQTY